MPSVGCQEASGSRPTVNAMSTDYPSKAANFFGERFAHRLRWCHAVNSKGALSAMLHTSVHFLEADVAAGPLISFESSGGSKPSTSVVTQSGDSVIMAHYPTQTSSDLSLEVFIQEVLAHNKSMGQPITQMKPAKLGTRSDARRRTSEGGVSSGAGCSSSSSGGERQSNTDAAAFLCEVNELRSVESASTGPAVTEACVGSGVGSALNVDEASKFAKELDQELESQAKHSTSVITACVGSRRDNKTGNMRTRKGVKLDFKLFDCVEPSIRYLSKIAAAKELGGHLWLNADVFAGPGALMSPMNAKQFVRLCAETIPEAVLSLSWGSSSLSATRIYTDDMVEGMIELCMTPIIPHLLPMQTTDASQALSSIAAEKERTNGASSDVSNGNHVVKDVFLTPVASCRHITFAVAAEYALCSARGLKKVLDNVPGTSLTIFTGMGSLAITTETVRDLIREYGETRVFLDLRVARPSRICGHGSCCMQ
eukprot:TRINITY_DN49037_c0_g1_i1.p1 TRINITY_DN49037_c0_g1~~TRINITY_DN49037_c0_g1_i1.p1  ORF type:complete len:523 (-),score=70.94 TRINITY_DN49037_c0_g1_i1:134-1579(-)